MTAVAAMPHALNLKNRASLVSAICLGGLVNVHMLSLVHMKIPFVRRSKRRAFVRHDDIAAGDDRRGEHVPVVGVGQG